MKCDPENNEIKVFLSICDTTNKKILEIGCGDGRFTSKIAPFAKEIIAIDKDEDSLAKAPRLPNVRYEKMNAQKMTFPDAEFDLVMTSYSLHEAGSQNMMPIIEEMKRVGKNEGLIFMEPIRKGLLSGKFFHLVEGHESIDMVWKLIKETGDYTKKDGFMKYYFDSFDDLSSFLLENYKGRTQHQNIIKKEIDRYMGKKNIVLKEWFRVAKMFYKEKTERNRCSTAA